MTVCPVVVAVFMALNFEAGVQEIDVLVKCLECLSSSVKMLRKADVKKRKDSKMEYDLCQNQSYDSCNLSVLVMLSSLNHTVVLFMTL